MTPAEPPFADRPRAVDFDIHGVLRVRAVEPGEADLRALSARLGRWVEPADVEPDLTLRPDDIHGAVRHLEALLSVAALDKGLAPLHGSGFVWDDRGVAIVGRAGGGKTGVLLAFMAQGAALVGDDWLALSADGSAMYGLPETIEARHAYVAALPEIAPRLTPAKRAWRTMRARLLGAVANGGPRSRCGGRPSLRRRAAARLERSLRLSLDPRSVFGERRCPGVGTPHMVVFAESHDDPGISVRPMTLEAAVRRATQATEDEWRHLSATNTRRELRKRALRQRLSRALAGKRLYALSQPHPAPPHAVFRALSPFVTDRVALPVA